jgi:hypothetical protein
MVSAKPKMRPRNRGISPLLFLILYYRKSVCNIFSMNIGFEVAAKQNHSLCDILRSCAHNAHRFLDKILQRQRAPDTDNLKDMPAFWFVLVIVEKRGEMFLALSILWGSRQRVSKVRRSGRQDGNQNQESIRIPQIGQGLLQLQQWELQVA